MKPTPQASCPIGILNVEYDNQQSALETAMTELQEQIDTWSEDKLKTDRFIDLVKRYTDFSELTKAMLNEFVEKVVVNEGDKRGNDRCHSSTAQLSKILIL